MLGNAYIKDKMMYLIYGDGNIGERTGVIYEIGKHLTDFLWFDIDSVDKAYVSFIHFYMKAIYENVKPMEEVKRELSERIDLLDTFSPYLHFYTQLLINFMIDYPKDKKATLTALAHALTSKGLLLTPFIHEIGRTADFTQVLLSGRRSCSAAVENFCSTIEDVADGAIKAKTAIIEDIKAKRECLFTEFEFIADGKKELQDMSVMQRLYLVDFKRKEEGKEPYYTGSAFTSQFVPVSRMVNKAETMEQLREIMQENAIDVVQMYVIRDLDDLIRFELLNIITNELVLKKCKYCGHYFVPYGRSDMEYCPRVYAGENKPCDQIGAMKLYQAKKQDDPVEMAFKKAYRRMNSKARRKIISQSEFYYWSEQARKKRDECHEGIITLGEFKNWLENDM